MLSLYRHLGTVYRAHDPQWSFSPTSGQGAASHGGRFNKPGTPALYTSTTIMGAVIEGAQNMMSRLPPMTIVSYEVDHGSVVDLTTVQGRAAASVNLADLACAWEYIHAKGEMPPSWAVGEMMRVQGAGAILVPSFANGADQQAGNLVFFTWGNAQPTLVTVIDDQLRLPRNQASWQ